MNRASPDPVLEEKGRPRGGAINRIIGTLWREPIVPLISRALTVGVETCNGAGPLRSLGQFSAYDQSTFLTADTHLAGRWCRPAPVGPVPGDLTPAGRWNRPEPPCRSRLDAERRSGHQRFNCTGDLLARTRCRRAGGSRRRTRLADGILLLGRPCCRSSAGTRTTYTHSHINSPEWDVDDAPKHKNDRQMRWLSRQGWHVAVGDEKRGQSQGESLGRPRLESLPASGDPVRSAAILVSLVPGHCRRTQFPADWCV